MATILDPSGMYVCIRKRGYIIAYGATKEDAEGRADSIEAMQKKQAHARKVHLAQFRRGKYNFEKDRIEAVTQ